jgi:sec-independent protein translocase protein TatB
MFDVGFSEILLIMVISLVVLGPEKLPKLAADIGRWIGRARAMARQLTTQLEQEVRLEEMLREQKRAPPPAVAAEPPPPPTPAVATEPTIQTPADAVADNPPAVGPGAPSAGAPTDEPHQHGPVAAEPAGAGLPSPPAAVRPDGQH